MKREEELENFLAAYGNKFIEYPREYKERYHKINKGAVLNSLATYYKYKAIKNFFFEKNSLEMRRNFYTSSLLNIKSRQFGMNNGFIDENFPFDSFLYAFLSDSTDLIHKIGNEEISYKDSPHNFHYYFFAIQLIINDKYDELENFLKNKKKSIFEFEFEVDDFFYFFMENDAINLSDYIKKLLNFNFDNSLDEKFIPKWATMCCKLCWRKGIEINIKGDKLPIELMPINPLEKYDLEYDFLSPDWVPPPGSFFSKFFK